jgi:RecA-family ATPase
MAIEQLLPASGNGLLVAQYKVGKTTLALNLAVALASGEPFLGKFEVAPMSGRVAFFNYELSERMFLEWAQDRIPDDHRDRIVTLHLRGRSAPFWNREVQDPLAAWLRRSEAEFLIIDPAAKAWRGLVDNENDNAKVEEFTSAVDELREAGGVSGGSLSTHHTGRYLQVEGEERARGATRLEDWMDAGWYYTKDESDTRSLRAMGRDVEMEAVDLQYFHDSRRLEAGQVREERRRDEGALAAVDALAISDKQCLSATELDELITGQKQSKVRCRRAAEEKGWIACEEVKDGRARRKSYTLTEKGHQAHGRRVQRQ